MKLLIRLMTRSNCLTLAVAAAVNLCLVGASHGAFWNFNDFPDTYEASDIDLSYLNEEVAGQSGWVTHRDGQFYRGDGQPIRFWGFVGGSNSYANAQAQARFVAKRGVNLVRFHASFYDNKAPSMETVSTNQVDKLHFIVKANKEQGIYTEISYFFILGLRIQPEWGIDGYTEQWVIDNPDSSQAAPFGLMFFDEKFKAAQKKWIETILTTPNRYDDDKKLADDPSIAIIEIQNEDNLFFYTWDVNRFPLEQQEKIFLKFGDFLKNKYGSLQAAATAWGTTTGATNSRDDFANGLATVTGAHSMSVGAVSGGGDSKRMTDQMEFMIQTQYNYYAEFKDFIRSLGYGGTFGASNWKTADNSNLQDAEIYTYTAAGVIDSHNYFGAYKLSKVAAEAGVGDVWYEVPVVLNPRSWSGGVKHVAGYPYLVSEVTWVNPCVKKSEGPILSAALCSLTGIDAWTWFAYHDPGWTQTYDNWSVGNPSNMGQFPGAALLYRRGDVDEATTLVREYRNLSSIYKREKNILIPPFLYGWDFTRDPDRIFNYDPSTDKGLVDTFATILGKAEIAFEEGDEDYVAPNLKSLFNDTTKSAQSANGQVTFDWAKGFMSVNSPLSQAVVGQLNQAGTVTLDRVVIRAGSGFDFGSILAISLDGKPIGQSTKVLLQAMTIDQLTGWKTTPQAISGFTGEKCVAVGLVPWQIKEIEGSVTFRQSGTAKTIKVLNENGYPIRQLAPQMVGGQLRVTLPKDALYTVVEFNPPTEVLPPEALTKELPLGVRGQPYAAQLRGAGGSGALTWALPAGVTLPDGLTLTADGKIAGTPLHGTDTTLAVELTDAASHTTTAQMPLKILPLNDTPGIFKDSTGTVRYAGGFAWNQLGFLYDGFYPFVYVYGHLGWIYVFSAPDTNEDSGYYFYDFAKEAFGWTAASIYPQAYLLTGPQAGQTFPLNQP